MSQDVAGRTVTASASEIARLRSYVAASHELTGWIEGARALALVDAALRVGLLEALSEPTSVDQLVAATRLDAAEVTGLCQALEAHDVVASDGERYRLTPRYRLLSGPTSAIPLSDVIRHAQVILRTLERGSFDEPYTALSNDDVLAMAAAAGISALSSSPHVSTDVVAQAIPEMDAAWRAGGRHLEVGCGVGNALFGILGRYPAVTAVGVEISGVIADEAKRRARSLGIDDRVEIREMDACDIADAQAFETVQWSQFFFPAATRPAVLAALLQAMKPGAYLLMPWLGTDQSDISGRRGEMLRTGARALRSRAATAMVFLDDALGDRRARSKRERRFASLQAVLFPRWGIPVRSVKELSAEVQAAGFDVVRAVPMPASQFVLTRGLLLARRPA